MSGGRDLISESELSNSIRDPVEDRQTLAEKNERLQNQLKVRVLISRLFCCIQIINISSSLSSH